MKILHVISSMEIGGAQRLLSSMLPIQQGNNDVTLLVLQHSNSEFQKELEELHIKIINLNCKNIYNPLIVIRLHSILKKYDIIHVHLFPLLYWVALASTSKNILIYTEHSTNNKRRNYSLFRYIERFIYKRYNKIVCISLKTRDNLINWLNVPKNDKRFVIIENGVSLCNFKKISTKEHSKDNHIIMISRFAKMKDQETLIRAMQYLESNADLVLVGDGPTRKHCEDIAKGMNLSHKIHFLGERTDIVELLNNSTIGVQSSKWEGFGLTAVEIMAAHIPVIATNVDGLRQVVENAGLLFEVGDAKDLAKIIDTLLQNHVLYDNVALKCYERAQLYDIKNTVNSYQEIYKSLIPAENTMHKK